MHALDVAAGSLTTASDGMRLRVDVTAAVRELLAAAATPAAILVVLGARGCNGCDVLARQLEAHGAAIGEGVEILKVTAGDFPTGRYASELSLGHASIGGPGIPLSVLFRVAAPAKLEFASLLLGPLDERRPAACLAELREGKSHWVAEAEEARIAACVGTICFSLDRSNAFRQPFSIILKDVP